LLPFLGTSLGAACVFFVRTRLTDTLQDALTGFAAGIMVAASVWSLLLPAMEQAAPMGRLAFLPAAAGLWMGVLLLLIWDRILPRLYTGTRNGKRLAMTVFAVTLHNIPEGMAVGIVLAGRKCDQAGITAAGVMALSLGIALQNFPEGAIVSVPLRAQGISKIVSFTCGVLSGAVEPVAALATLLAAGWITALLPCLLGFAAGAMLCVAVKELIPSFSDAQDSNVGTFFFTLGFLLMMVLDTALG